MLSWWFVDLASRALAPAEREAVRGDLAESNQPSGRALCDVLGLIVRRQAAQWTAWGPWIALLCVIPVSTTLNVLARRDGGLTAIYAWLYVNNWTSGYLAAGFRQDLIHDLTTFGFSYFKLMFAAWAGGLTLGFLSRRAIGINGFLFLLVLVLRALTTTPGEYGPNAPVFALNFYRLVLPCIVLTMLVLIPAFRGMHDGLKLSRRFAQ
jgi:hypothetical protein